MSETTNFKSGAVRSSDANHLDFTSLPLLGLIGVARTASEGGTKYGRHNYIQGIPAHDLLNHAFRHMLLFLLGDRSEPHLEHAAWGLLAAVQSLALDPEISTPHLLGPGATLTAANRELLAAQAPELAARRKAGEFEHIGEWTLAALPEVATLLEQRRLALLGGGCEDPDEDEDIPAEEPQAYQPVVPPSSEKWTKVIELTTAEHLRKKSKTRRQQQIRWLDKARGIPDPDGYMNRGEDGWNRVIFEQERPEGEGIRPFLGEGI